MRHHVSPGGSDAASDRRFAVLSPLVPTVVGATLAATAAVTVMDALQAPWGAAR